MNPTHEHTGALRPQITVRELKEAVWSALDTAPKNRRHVGQALQTALRQHHPDSEEGVAAFGLAGIELGIIHIAADERSHLRVVEGGVRHG